MKGKQVSSSLLICILVLYCLEGQAFVNINWPRVPHVKKYQIEIYNDENLTEKVVEKTTTKNNYKWKTKKTGVFYLRVASIDGWSEQGEWSPVSKIIITAKNNKQQPIILKYPPNLFTWNKSQPFDFLWEGLEKNNSTFLLAKDPQFKTVFIEEELDGQSLSSSIAKELNNGIYFWRVDSKKNQVPKSEVRQLEISHYDEAVEPFGDDRTKDDEQGIELQGPKKKSVHNFLLLYRSLSYQQESIRQKIKQPSIMIGYQPEYQLFKRIKLGGLIARDISTFGEQDGIEPLTHSKFSAYLDWQLPQIEFLSIKAGLGLENISSESKTFGLSNFSGPLIGLRLDLDKLSLQLNYLTAFTDQEGLDVKNALFSVQTNYFFTENIGAQLSFETGALEADGDKVEMSSISAGIVYRP